MDNEHEYSVSGELISASVDGELSGEEQARVERLLATSPEHQQLLDELRALRENLQSLPRYRLGDDFSRRLLRRARREMLSQQTDQEVGGAAAEDPGAAAEATAPASANRRSWRGGVLAVCALAAVLVLAFFAPWTAKEVATVTKQPPSPPAESAEPAPTEMGETIDEGIGSIAVERKADTPEVANQAGTFPSTGWQELSKKITLPAAPQMVMALNVRSDAFRGRTFDQSLAKHRVHTRAIETRAAPAVRLANGSPRPEKAPENGTQLKTERLAQRPTGDSESNAVMFVYAEPTEEQLRAALEDLRSRPDQFVPRYVTYPSQVGPAYSTQREILQRAADIVQLRPAQLPTGQAKPTGKDAGAGGAAEWKPVAGRVASGLGDKKVPSAKARSDALQARDRSGRRSPYRSSRPRTSLADEAARPGHRRFELQVVGGEPDAERPKSDADQEREPAALADQPSEEVLPKLRVLFVLHEIPIPDNNPTTTTARQAVPTTQPVDVPGEQGPAD